MTTQGQRNYAVERIRGKVGEKLEAAKHEFHIEGKGLTNMQRLDLIRKGKVTLLPKKELSLLRNWDRTNIKDVFDFSEYAWESGVDKKKYGKREKAILTESNRIIDEVMLGDAKEAMKLLKAFETF